MVASLALFVLTLVVVAAFYGRRWAELLDED